MGAGSGVAPWADAGASDRLLALADLMRATGCVVRERLMWEAVAAQQRGLLSVDAVSRSYRHAMIHAGGIRRLGGERFPVCPVCERVLSSDDTVD